MGFDEIYGNERPLSVLKRAVFTGSAYQSYIFFGKEGVGKLKVAKGVAAALNCTSPLRGEGDFCGQCSSCRRMAREVHPALFMVRREGGSKVIKIEIIRELQERLHFKIFEGGMRVVIIDSAESMNIEAQNCLLRTIEEPPEKCMIVLVTPSLSTLLPTIRSRCQKLRFLSVPENDIKMLLQKERGIKGERGTLIARFSRGSVGKALDIADSFDDHVALRDRVLEGMESLLNDEASFIQVSEELFRWFGNRIPELIQILQLITRDLIILCQYEDTKPVTNLDRIESMRSILRRVDLDGLLGFFENLNTVRRGYDLNISPLSLIENTFMKLRAKAA